METKWNWFYHIFHITSVFISIYHVSVFVAQVISALKSNGCYSIAYSNLFGFTDNIPKMIRVHDDVIKRKYFPPYWPFVGEFTSHQWIPSQKPVTWSFAVFFDLRLNKPLKKQSWGWWIEMPSCSLWHQYNELVSCYWYYNEICYDGWDHRVVISNRVIMDMAEVGAFVNILWGLHIKHSGSKGHTGSHLYVFHLESLNRSACNMTVSKRYGMSLTAG